MYVSNCTLYHLLSRVSLHYINCVLVTSVLTVHSFDKRNQFTIAYSHFVVILFLYYYYVCVPLQSFLCSPIIFLVSRLSIVRSKGGVFNDCIFSFASNFKQVPLRVLNLCYICTIQYFHMGYIFIHTQPFTIQIMLSTFCFPKVFIIGVYV